MFGKRAQIGVCIGWVLVVFWYLSLPQPLPEPYPASSEAMARSLYNPALAKVVDQSLRDYWQKPDQVLDSLGSLEGLKVADIGCGDGYFTLPLLKAVGEHGKVYATDIQVEMLDQLRKRVPEADRSRITLIHAQGEKTGVPEPVDLILLVQVYGEIPEKEPFLASLQEIMHAKTRLVIIDSRHITDANGFTRPISHQSIVAELERHGFQLDPHYRKEAFSFLPKQFFLILNTKG